MVTNLKRLSDALDRNAQANKSDALVDYLRSNVISICMEMELTGQAVVNFQGETYVVRKP